jgi:DNA-binding MarR family transcriptional regulator
MPTSELYNLDNYQRAESVGYLLSAVKARLVTALDADLAELGLTGAQFGTLMAIADGEEKTAADICRSTGCDTGAMTRMLDRLEEKGLLRRERSTEDRRVVHIRLTDAGRDLPQLALPAVIGVLNRHLTGFSREELETLKSLLRRMLANAA